MAIPVVPTHGAMAVPITRSSFTRGGQKRASTKARASKGRRSSTFSPMPM